MKPATSVTSIPPVDLAALHANDPEHYPFLLQSVASSPLSHYDILFCHPQSELVLNWQGRVETNAPNISKGVNDTSASPFLDTLENWWQQHHVAPPKHPHAPFRGGWFVYFAYELAQEVEPSLQLQHDDSTLPKALAVRVPAAIIHNRKTNTYRIVVEYQYRELSARIQNDIKQLPDRCKHRKVSVDELTTRESSRFISAVTRAKQYIKDGDIFQANLSRRWKTSTNNTASDIYHALCASNPAPFAGIIQRGNNAIISSSPERLASIKHQAMGARVDVRPIAGTRPRGDTAADDRKLKRTLIGNPKERAEHVMLIDLERNDLGRVCIPGTVEVNELMALESYTHVHHIVSNITGILASDTSPVDVIRACFPGGTITGCPKVRCMEIINELESESRGPYTGSMGYINLDGSMDLNILIRTIVKEGNTISFRAGAGIVADSEPEKELAETYAKALGMINAVVEK